MGAEPPAESRGTAPGGVKGVKPPEVKGGWLFDDARSGK